ncbi:contact-dependent growth inhibition system immunity protein [Pseudomonas sp. ChxA]|uniref:contact-dependent growth inhibition system immunity protein n=1 Tax=Pseudomonas sp. ChxA TaxID=3035473 RepID=UPI002552B2E5|nr:contact-dependent growth inhibition system immunity protein [Pseudomonas sp. ChxA]MDL2186442.1 contact-dependent growth inhibition system immunity protein [Pseudomonas sp. ChxA]
MNELLTELQQFLGAYLHQDWVEEHSSADEVIDSFLLDSSRDVIITVKQEILELISSYKNELDFQEKLLQVYSCYYYYPNQWISGPLWLNHIVNKFDLHLLKTIE